MKGYATSKKRRRMSDDARYALNAICPYFTMFPLEYPIGLLRRFPRSTLILDPFCGRGTTLYAARMEGREAWGVDSSAVAVAIARAKLANTTPAEAVRLAEEILSRESDHRQPSGRFWSIAYHHNTLRQVSSLRFALMSARSEAAKLLRAICLGALHGPLYSSPSYFSNQMPRTFAPKPDYAVKYLEKKYPKAPEINVLEVIRKRAARLEMDSASQIALGRVIRGDAERNATYRGFPTNFDLIITSPPYFGMDTYLPDQWIRYWFMGGPERVDYRLAAQLSHSNLKSFVQSLANTWQHMTSFSSRHAHMFLRFGCLPSKLVNPIATLRKSFTLSGNHWKVVSVRKVANAPCGKRQARQMRIRSSAQLEYDVHAIRVVR